MADAAPLVVGLELAIVEEPRQDAAGEADVVEVPLIERQKLRHLFLEIEISIRDNAGTLRPLMARIMGCKAGSLLAGNEISR